MGQDAVVFTVGYAGYATVEALTGMLEQHGVRLLVDVRHVPYSAHRPQFNQEPLRLCLATRGIRYRHYAAQFGARQEDPRFYRNGRLDFVSFTESEPFADGVKKLFSAITAGYPPALLCAEKEPVCCHRAIMIAPALEREDSGCCI